MSRTDIEELFGIIVATIIGIFLCFIIFGPFDFCLQSGGGTQSGFIAEIEETGIFYRPATVRLLNIIPTYSSKDTMFDYGIEPELVELARHYQTNQTPCSVQYRIAHFIWSWDYSDIVIITNITTLK